MVALWPLSWEALAVVVAAASLFSFFLLRRLARPRTVQVTGLYYYPVKSFAGIQLDAADLDHMGILLDRHWCVVNPQGRFITAREFPKMVTIRPSFNSAGQLVLNANGMPPITVPQEPTSVGLATVWDSEFEAGNLDYPELSKWLSDFIGVNCRLAVILPKDQHSRTVPPAYQSQCAEDIRVPFSDAFPFLLISEESLKALQKKCPEPIVMQNFRPNIIVRGCYAYEEDTWREIRIGNVTFSVPKHCTRCLLTTVNPSTGQRNKKGEPLKTLRRVRNSPLKGPPGKDEDTCFFGVNLSHLHPGGSISVGDSVTVLQSV